AGISGNIGGNTMRKNAFALVLGLASVMTTPLETSAAVLQGSSRAATETPVVSVQYWRGGPHWRGRPHLYARPGGRRPYYGRGVAGGGFGPPDSGGGGRGGAPGPAPRPAWALGGRPPHSG